METATKKKKKQINLNRNYNSHAKICKPNKFLRIFFFFFSEFESLGVPNSKIPNLVTYFYLGLCYPVKSL